MIQAPHAKSVEKILEAFQITSESGLSQEQLAAAQQQGRNELPAAGQRRSSLQIFIRQWLDPLVLILVASATVTGILAEYTDMTVILITIGINIVIGYIQEKKASTALAALQRMISYSAIVIRGGEQMLIPSEEVVVGDILLVEAGDKLQADGRILEAHDLHVNEAALTGESEPQRKKTDPVDEGTKLNDRICMVYRGTTVTNGTATILVTAVGVETEIGKIATMVKETKDEKTPLQQQLSRLGTIISLVVLALAVGIFLLGTFFRPEITHIELFKTAVAVAVAAVPGGLVIALTIILALGMQTILKQQALVRKMVAAETLGSVNVICTDKTGTLTKGEMSVTQIQLGSQLNTVSLAGVESLDGREQLRALLVSATLANDAKKNTSDKVGAPDFVGDTTDTAIARAGVPFLITKKELQSFYTMQDKVPFDSDNMYMAALTTGESGTLLHLKGAPERVLQMATTMIEPDGSERALDDTLREEINRWLTEWTGQQLRVIAVARAVVGADTTTVPEHPSELQLLGFICLQDPLRHDVLDTLAQSRAAGIRTIMITGDHANTAAAIGRSIGLLGEDENEDDRIITGEEFAQLSDDELQRRLERVRIFARVAPEDKLRIVAGLKAQGAVVAMTGDGVNDSPALKAADIGIALGSGTDVAKEVADLVLLDDRFSTIVAAIGQGRSIYDNIRKVIVYLISGGFAEVILVTGSLIAGLPIPALPTQILWVNIIENLFPTIALTFDPSEKENMDEPPRPRSQRLLDPEVKTMIVSKSIAANILLFTIFYMVWKSTGDIVLTRTVVFVGFAIDALFFIYAVRSFRFMVWQRPIFNNKTLTLSVALGWVLLLGAVYAPPLQRLLTTVPLPPFYWIIMVGFGIFNLVLIEIIKFIFLHKKPHLA